MSKKIASHVVAKNSKVGNANNTNIVKKARTKASARQEALKPPETRTPPQPAPASPGSHATPKQVQFLSKQGFKDVATWPHAEAAKMIDRIATNRWKVPAGINPETYTPEMRLYDKVLNQWRVNAFDSFENGGEDANGMMDRVDQAKVTIAIFLRHNHETSPFDLLDLIGTLSPEVAKEFYGQIEILDILHDICRDEEANT